MSAAAGILRGRLAIITGAGSGIGRAVCQVFAGHGARVAAVDISDKVHESVQQLAQGAQHKGFLADISSGASVDCLFSAVRKEFEQGPCCVINCAGITREKLLLKMSEKDFDDVINVNLKGTFLMTQAAAKSMIQDKISNGSIVNISSIIAKAGNIGQCNYAASKAGVVGFTKSAARELARFGIRCNAVLPGFIDTPMIQTIPEKIFQTTIAQVPLARVGKPEEVGDTCVYLVSDGSSYITGACIEVTGGLYM